MPHWWLGAPGPPSLVGGSRCACWFARQVRCCTVRDGLSSTVLACLACSPEARSDPPAQCAGGSLAILVAAGSEVRAATPACSWHGCSLGKWPAAYPATRGARGEERLRLHTSTGVGGCDRNRDVLTANSDHPATPAPVWWWTYEATAARLPRLARWSSIRATFACNIRRMSSGVGRASSAPYTTPVFPL